MKKVLLLGTFAVLALIASARADLIPSFVSATPDGNGNTIFSYSLNITVDQNAMDGDYFTIYDFGDFIQGSNVQPAGWTFSFQPVGITPSDTVPPDDPQLFNLTWTWTGATIPGGSPEGTNIGLFSVTVPGLRPNLISTYFAAQGTRSGDPLNTKVGNVGQIVIPAPIPEPSTFALVGGTAILGMVGRALARRRRL